MKWIRVHIEGVVQGVGFRPFVYKLALGLNIKGWVCNGLDGVHIEAGGSPEQIEMFSCLLTDDAPAESHITKVSTEYIPEQQAEDFQIVESNSEGKATLMITPDLGLCDQCRQEIADPENKRCNYPFTTCTHCGPRYSIIKALPYDRHLTSMGDFKMCESCEKEYDNAYDRRYYSQTNSCPTCSIPVRLVDNKGNELTSFWDEALEQVVEKLKEGKIIAVKGIGGYLLIADATNESAIAKLRERKHRPSKPFALMYPNVEALSGDAQLSEVEKTAFKSIQSPIVLVKLRKNPTSGICVNQIAPDLDRIGAMQPYTALYELLLKAFGKPILATSGNVGGSPILFKDEDALENLKEIADAFLINEREIQTAQDDSVVRYTRNDQRIIIRRSRGYAPNLISHIDAQSQCVLAMGADMKSCFAIQANGRVYTSQYLGDLESYESQESFRSALNHLLTLLNVKPDRILVDKHPGYFSTRLGNQLAKQWQIPVEAVQHHKSHAYAVLAENNKLHDTTPILCVVSDGTGYGDDHQIWGGEFFVYQDQLLDRVSHFTYFPVWQGDLTAHEPRLSALFLCKDFLEETDLRSRFSEKEWTYFSKLIETTPTHYTSSVGRLFDAVALLLSVADHNSFEGEAAMHLEVLATNGTSDEHYAVSWNGHEINQRDLIKQILDDLKKDLPKAEIALKFHAYLADVIFEVLAKFNVNQVALSGGVFQNALLLELIQEKIQPNMKMYIHQELSPNDENISLGQLAMAAMTHTEETEGLLLATHLN